MDVDAAQRRSETIRLKNDVQGGVADGGEEVSKI